MTDEVPAVVPPTVADVYSAAPSPELPPPGESTLPAPTAEQAQTVDRIFTAPSQPHGAATFLGVLTSALLLRDVAVDTFDTSEEEDEAKKKPDKDTKPAD